MIIQDFFYMWRGKEVKPLPRSEKCLLGPIQIKNNGRKRALLMLHGFSSSPAVFRALLPKLTRYDALVCPLLPGHGESIAAFAQVKASAWVQAAESACEALVHDYDEVDVLGVSLGGLLACHLGRRFNLHHIYLLAPALRLHINIPIILWCTRALNKFGCRYVRNRAGSLYMHIHDELAYRKLPLTTIIELLTLIQQSNQNGTYNLTTPTDLFVGRHDEVVDSSHVSALLGHNHQVTTHWLENSAHVLPLDGDIDTIAKCLNDYSACIPA